MEHVTAVKRKPSRSAAAAASHEQGIEMSALHRDRDEDRDNKTSGAVEEDNSAEDEYLEDAQPLLDSTAVEQEQQRQQQKNGRFSARETLVNVVQFGIVGFPG